MANCVEATYKMPAQLSDYQTYIETIDDTKFLQAVVIEVAGEVWISVISKT